MLVSARVLCTCVALLYLAGESLGENIQDYICNRRFRGYKIDYARRQCTVGRYMGCTSPFPYKTRRECLRDFHGKGNICERGSPCENGGICSPITTQEKGRTFKCDCSETGFYGDQCQTRCPRTLTGKISEQTACIQIG